MSGASHALDPGPPYGDASIEPTGISPMKRIAALVAQPVSLLIMGCALMFDFPTWVGIIGLVIGAAGLFIPDWWAASRPRKR